MNWILLATIGLITGLIGAMLGIGGSVLLIPALNELRGPHQHAHQACAMIVTVFVAVPAAWRYLRAGLVMRPLAWRLIPGAVAAVIAGVACSQAAAFSGAREGRLVALFGGFLLAVCGYNIWRLRRRAPVEPGLPDPVAGSWTHGLTVGVPTGFVAGLLGVGGGLVAVPLQQLLLGLRLKPAIANSTVLICAVGSIGALYKNYCWAQAYPEQALEPLNMAVVLMPTVLVGSLLGSRLTQVLPNRAVRMVFILVLITAGLRQLARGLALG